MTEDRLLEASRVLQRLTEGEDEGHRFTRARIMASLHRARRRRVARLTLAVPLAAVFVGSTAWGSASGRLPQAYAAMLDAVAGILAPTPPPALSPVPRATAGRVGAPGGARRALGHEAGDPPSAVERGTLAPSPSAADALAVPAAPRRTVLPRTPPASRPRRPAALPAAGDPQDLYRTGHRLHFAHQDWRASLAAWNEYLALAPDGGFAPEAAYNRGICLAHLGRLQEAEAALTPFADGQYGDYRRREAMQLIGAMKAAGEAEAEPSGTGAGNR